MNKAISASGTGFPHKAARSSWVCALLVFVLIVVGSRTGARLAIEFLSFGLMLVGGILALIAFFGIPKFGWRGLLAQAIAGALANGLLLFIFISNFLKARGGQ
jgi:hypothetical protein